MMGTFTKLAGQFGFSGVIAFFKIKAGCTKNLRLKGLTCPITLRPGTSDIATFKHIFAHGDYNLQITPGPKVIVDAGANIGLSAIYFANRFPEARIIAIELSPENYRLLNKNTRHYPGITTVHAGLWPKNEVLKFKQEGVSPWGYRVDNTLANGSVPVASITMNDILNRYRLATIDLLKIDIEGAEVELFAENYTHWLPKVRCLVIEFHDRWRPGSSATVTAALAKCNFRAEGTVGENAVFINRGLL